MVCFCFCFLIVFLFLDLKGFEIPPEISDDFVFNLAWANLSIMDNNCLLKFFKNTDLCYTYLNVFDTF